MNMLHQDIQHLHGVLSSAPSALVHDAQGWLQSPEEPRVSAAGLASS